MILHISHGNRKTGPINSISLSTNGCSDMPCYDTCYAHTLERRYPSVRSAWEENRQIALRFPDYYFWALSCFMEKNKPAYFRFHVGGEIPNQDYLDRMKVLADEFPDTKYMVFTKRHDLNFKCTPKNLCVVLSMWPGFGNTRKKMPRAWMDDGTDKRIPSNALECPGHCSNCMACWGLHKRGIDVVFKKHG